MGNISFKPAGDSEVPSLVRAANSKLTKAKGKRAESYNTNIVIAALGNARANILEAESRLLPTSSEDMRQAVQSTKESILEFEKVIYH